MDNSCKVGLSSLKVNNFEYFYYPLSAAKKYGDYLKLPFSKKILLENLLRHYKATLTDAHLKAFFSSDKNKEIYFFPSRVLMQDFTGVPCLVDLAAMRDAMIAKGGDPSKINPLIPVDLIIDHSITVNYFAKKDSFSRNVKQEYHDNYERYTFLKWAKKSFQNVQVVPPGTGICHQVNLEYLAKVVWCAQRQDGKRILYPDTVLGTDSHTTMINALSVLGWGVGGIEAEAAMVGAPMSMLIPDVIGVRLEGKLPPGTTATDLVLTITQRLRTHNVVGKFVEFYGEGIKTLSLADRATIANMAPEYGATCGFFPIDEETLKYLHLTGRQKNDIDCVEAYAKAQGLWHDIDHPPLFDEVLTLDLSTVETTLAGPKRPQDKLTLNQVKNVSNSLEKDRNAYPVAGQSFSLKNHAIVIAAITSCTNTSNPSAMIGAALLAKKAKEKGLTPQPWVKPSFAPGSQVVTSYLENAVLMRYLEFFGFYLVGYGCTTCIGNSGPLGEGIKETIEKNNLTVSSVLSGNRNFEGRIHPYVKANYLASPALVVAYALAGTTAIDLTSDPIQGTTYLKDIWPKDEEIREVMNTFITPSLFNEKYSEVFKGDNLWNSIEGSSGLTYPWNIESTYVKKPPYFSLTHNFPPVLKGMRILALLGDSVTTDHISPAGNIKKESPAGHYLIKKNVEEKEFNSYGSRRGNHEIMVRGTFANVRLVNEIIPEKPGGYTRCWVDNNKEMAIYDASVSYQKQQVPLVIIAGKEYGTGSSRDWAAKGTRLLGIKAVIAESFERIHRSNLVGMGVLPLQFEEGTTRHTLSLKGNEIIDLDLKNLAPKSIVYATIHQEGEDPVTISLLCRIDTPQEHAYFQKGGILPFTLEEISDQ